MSSSSIPSPLTERVSLLKGDTSQAPLEQKNNYKEPRGGETIKAAQLYEKLVKLLEDHKLHISKPNTRFAIEGPGFYVFRVLLPRGVSYQKIKNLKDNITLGLALKRGLIPKIETDEGCVIIEIPKSDNERYFIKAEELWERAKWTSDCLYTPIGLDIHSNVIGINFSSSTSCHLLIGGMTGSGKSVVLDTILWGLIKHYAPEELEIKIIDPKGNEFILFQEQPHIRDPIGISGEDAEKLLELACDEMDRRYELMTNLTTKIKSKVPDIITYNKLVSKEERFRWMVLVLDEYADLTSNRMIKKNIEILLKRLAQKARAIGIHVIAGTQKPSAEVISSTIRSNFPAQLALRVKTHHDSKIIMDETGAECLTGKGDAFFRCETPIRIQCAYVNVSQE